MYRGAVLDLDGTLWDSSFYERRVVEDSVRAMRMAGLPASAQQEAVNRLMRIRKKDVNAPNHFDQLCCEYALIEEAAERIVRIGVDAYHKTRDSLLVPQPETINFLEFIAKEGFKSCIVTQGIREKQIDKLRRLGILKYFSTIVEDGSFVYVLENAVDRIEGKKGLVLEAIAKLEIDPSLSFVIDDRPYGIVAAKSVGIRYGIRMKAGKYSDESYPEVGEELRENVSVENLNQAMRVINEIGSTMIVLRAV